LGRTGTLVPNPQTPITASTYCVGLFAASSTSLFGWLLQLRTPGSSYYPATATSFPATHSNLLRLKPLSCGKADMTKNLPARVKLFPSNLNIHSECTRTNSGQYKKLNFRTKASTTSSNHCCFRLRPTVVAFRPVPNALRGPMLSVLSL